MQKTFDVTGPVELEIKLNSGEIQVEAVEGAQQAEVELIAHDEESERLIEAARVEFANGRLLVDVPKKRSGFSFAVVFGHGGISCRVRCPEGSDVTTRTKSADGILGTSPPTASGSPDAKPRPPGGNGLAAPLSSRPRKRASPGSPPRSTPR